MKKYRIEEIPSQIIDSQSHRHRGRQAGGGLRQGPSRQCQGARRGRSLLCLLAYLRGRRRPTAGRQQAAELRRCLHGVKQEVLRQEVAAAAPGDGSRSTDVVWNGSRSTAAPRDAGAGAVLREAQRDSWSPEQPSRRGLPLSPSCWALLLDQTEDLL